MKKKEKKKEKNTRFFLIILGIPLLFFAYYIFSNNQTIESKPLNDAEYEVATGKLVYDRDIHNQNMIYSRVEEFLTEAQKIDNSDAVFFIGHDEEEYSTALYKTIDTANKEQVNALTDGKVEQGIEIFYRDIGPFLDTKYDKMGPKESYYQGEMSPTGKIFPKQTFGGINAPVVDENGEYWPGLNETFGTDIYDYFQEHELKIKCEDINLEKLCVCTEIKRPRACHTTSGYYEQTETYIYVGTAEVTTKHAVGDMEEFGVFGNEGETVKIKIYARGGSFGIHDMRFEKM